MKLRYPETWYVEVFSDTADPEDAHEFAVGPFYSRREADAWIKKHTDLLDRAYLVAEPMIMSEPVDVIDDITRMAEDLEA